MRRSSSVAHPLEKPMETTVSSGSTAIDLMAPLAKLLLRHSWTVSGARRSINLKLASAHLIEHWATNVKTDSLVLVIRHERLYSSSTNTAGLFRGSKRLDVLPVSRLHIYDTKL